MRKISLNNKKILITGAAGFIGAFLARRLLIDFNCLIVGLDNLNDYYDVNLKYYRLDILKNYENFKFIKGSIADKELVKKIFNDFNFDIVINLAAQAGVRYSIENPDAYINSNILGFYNILEACRNAKNLEHFIYASSSSVYGGNKKIPFSTDDKTDSPVSLYAATKKSNELIAHAYSNLYKIPCTGLRFFTVYGPAGRPDMFYFSAANNLRAGNKIKIFNYGDCKRDFTYIDDIIEGIIRVVQGAPDEDKNYYALYNIGGGRPRNLLNFIATLQYELVRAGVLPEDYDFEAHRELVAMQPGDVVLTYADTTELERDFNFKPKIDIQTGLRNFAEWYKDFYK